MTPTRTVSLLLASVGLVLAGWGGATPAAAAVQEEPEAYSLFGKPLFRLPLAEEQRAKLERDLAAARSDYDRDPRDPENIIWLGRRLAYLWRYRDAIDVYSRGIVLHPDSYKLYRHRGHRYITIREFDKAVADLTKASRLIEGVPDEIEPDGAPNPYNKPRSTSHSNIWYHLGLAHYLAGDLESALHAYRECMKVSTNDDMLVATADWLYMTARRLGRDNEAAEVLEPIREEMEILENDAYQKRLLMYKGLRSPESLLDPANLTDLDLATQGYGVGNWYYYNGEPKRAKAIFEKVLEGTYWSAFGYIAAEADLKRSSSTR